MVSLNNAWIYLKYFLYIGINWNFRLALTIIIHEIKGEKKYCIKTTGIDDLTTSVSTGELKRASIYQPINYYIAEALFNQLEKEDLTTGFLDAGCGRGRAMAMAVHYGFARIDGFDFSPKLCHEAIQVLEPFSQRNPTLAITVTCENAKKYQVDDATSILFIFNPFGGSVMKDFIAQVQKSLHSNPRTFKVLYANPQCKKLWLDAGFEEIYYIKKLQWLEGSILVKHPSVRQHIINSPAK